MSFTGRQDKCRASVLGEDGYAYACGLCAVRHGEKRYGERTIEFKRCPKCEGKRSPRHKYGGDGRILSVEEV